AAEGYVLSDSGPDHSILSTQLPTRTEVGQGQRPVEWPACGVDDCDLRLQTGGFGTEALDEVAPGCRQTPGQRNPQRSRPGRGLGAAQRGCSSRGQCAAG